MKNARRGHESSKIYVSKKSKNYIGKRTRKETWKPFKGNKKESTIFHISPLLDIFSVFTSISYSSQIWYI